MLDENFSHQEFVDYYAAQSLSNSTKRHFERLRDMVLKFRNPDSEQRNSRLDILDVGCGAGTLSMLFAEAGHRVTGLDINPPLLELACERAAQSDLTVNFQIGSAEKIPCSDASMDICMVPELLEHVENWEACLDEFHRVLRRKGVLFLSTTNALSPRQQEYTLPLYSWYPKSVKRRFEELARTTHPQIANHARFPAVNWFTYYQLRKELIHRGFGQVFDRFDIAAVRRGKGNTPMVLRLIRSSQVLRLCGQIMKGGTSLVAIKP